MNGYKPCPLCGGIGYLQDKKNLCISTFSLEVGTENQPYKKKCAINSEGDCELFLNELCEDCECPECEGCGEILE